MGLKLRKSEIQTELVLGSNNDLLRKLREGVVDAAIMGQPEDAADAVHPEDRARSATVLPVA